jgi:hypothetical protein
VWLRLVQERLDRELELAEQLRQDPSARRRLDDIVTAREVYGLSPRLPELMGRAGMTVDSFIRKGKEWMTEFLDDLPTIAVQKQIRRQIFANGSRPWKVNDIRDLDALSVAVPCCDVVVGDKEAINALKLSTVIQDLGARLISRPEELLELLDEA